MATTYTTNLQISLIGNGDQAGTWGDTTNYNWGEIEEAVAGYISVAVTTGSTTTITIPNGPSSGTAVARNMYIVLTGTGGASTYLEVPTNKKLYFVYNSTAGAVTVRVLGQTGVSVPAGCKYILVCNGTDIVNAALNLAGTANYITKVTSVNSIANSIIYDDGTNIGIGTITPAAKLDVAGAVKTTGGILPRINSQTNITSPWAWNSDSYDQQYITALANNLTINADSGSPTNGQKAIFRIKDNGTARTLNFISTGSKSFRAIGVNLPTLTTANKTLYIGCIYNAADSYWDVIAVALQG